MMLVPVGRGRMFFHAGCWRVKAVRELAADSPKVNRRVVGVVSPSARSCRAWRTFRERELRGESRRVRRRGVSPRLRMAHAMSNSPGIQSSSRELES